MSALRIARPGLPTVLLDQGPSGHVRPSGPIGGALVAHSIAPYVSGGAIPATRPAPVFHIKPEKAK